MPSTSHFLMVPIRLDALFLDKDLMVKEAAVDFSKLPFHDGQRDINPDTPNLGEAIRSQPMRDRGLNLKAGMHLHWALPEALTVGEWDGETAKFPAVPNRWVVLRTRSDTVEHAWMVESDYLFPPGKGGNLTAVSMPHPMHGAPRPGQPPFRYMGRRMDLAAWRETDPDATYLDKLTSAGYGDPAFAAYYPNCHSVFGFHDGGTTEPTQGLGYEVYGFYSEPNADHLRKVIEACLAENTVLDARGMAAKIGERLRWAISLDAGQPMPQRTLCYARLTFDPADDLDNPDLKAPCTLAMGATGTEALSALLAHELSPEHQSMIEDQLEALHLAPALDGRASDLGFKFLEARHGKGFHPLKAGSRWTVKQRREPRREPRRAAGAAHDVEESQKRLQITLPPAMAAQLNRLNQAQAAHDRARHHLASRRRQLFADWYKTMMCAYRPEDAADELPDADELRFFTEQRVMAAFDEALAATGVLSFATDSAGNITRATGSGNGDSTSILLAVAWNEMAAAVTAFNATDAVTTSGAVYMLADEEAPRYWQPNDPVVLISGDAALHTPRHGQDMGKGDDGLLPCLVLASTRTASDLLRNDLATLRDRVDTIAQDRSDRGRAFTTWQRQPWHPLIMEWEVAVYPVKDGSNLNAATHDYAADFLTRNYDLNEKNPVLRLKSGKGFSPAAATYQGSCILTPHATIKLAGDLRSHFLRLVDPVLERFYTDEQVPAENRNTAWLEQYIPQIISWFREHDLVLKLYRADKGIQTADLDIPDLLDWLHGGFHVRQTYIFHLFETQKSVSVSGLDWILRHAADFIAWVKTFAKGDLGPLYAEKHIGPKNQDEDYLQAHAGVALDWCQAQVKDGSTYVDSNEFIDWFKEFMQDFTPFYDDESVAASDRGDPYLRTHVNQIIDWFHTRVKRTLGMANLGGAYLKLANKRCLSQALGGFHQAMLGLSETFQLPIGDPLGFVDTQPFTERVARKLGRCPLLAPKPLNSFLPIRSGLLALLGLRLIDSFGRIKDDFNTRTLVTSETMTPKTDVHSGERDWAYLSPAFPQGARLNFRWLAARDGLSEMNDHPATTPVCGWVLPNNLDSSLMFYDETGAALGSVDVAGHWRTAPGRDVPVEIVDFANPYLRKVAAWIALSPLETDAAVIARKQALLAHLIIAIDNALELIDPESFAAHRDLALLMGRPVAVTRARVGLELAGVPAINQTWLAMREDLRRAGRDSDGFTQVELPVRIGEYGQLNDGLVGFWQEDGEGALSEKYVALQSQAVGDAHIITHGEHPHNLKLKADAPPLTLTMLVDPRGKVHASCGLLPTKTVSIPPDQYAEALAAIRVTFLSTPILTEQDTVALPLPNEPGFVWSWLDHGPLAWRELSTAGVVKKAVLVSALPDGELIWQTLIDQGWIKPIDETKATVVPRDQRKTTNINDGLEADRQLDEKTQEQIEHMLDAGHISQVGSQARFAPAGEIREGWLTLSKKT